MAGRRPSGVHGVMSCSILKVTPSWPCLCACPPLSSRVPHTLSFPERRSAPRYLCLTHLFTMLLPTASVSLSSATRKLAYKAALLLSRVGSQDHSKCWRECVLTPSVPALSAPTSVSFRHCR